MAGNMREIKVFLDEIDKVKEFVSIVSRFDADMDLTSGRYVADAKSIMGIFSMDLSKPLTLKIHADGGDTEEVISALGRFIVN